MPENLAAGEPALAYLVPLSHPWRKPSNQGAYHRISSYQDPWRILSNQGAYHRISSYQETRLEKT